MQRQLEPAFILVVPEKSTANQLDGSARAVDLDGITDDRTLPLTISPQPCALVTDLYVAMLRPMDLPLDDGEGVVAGEPIQIEAGVAARLPDHEVTRNAWPCVTFRLRDSDFNADLSGFLERSVRATVRDQVSVRKVIHPIAFFRPPV